MALHAQLTMLMSPSTLCFQISGPIWLWICLWTGLNEMLQENPIFDRRTLRTLSFLFQRWWGFGLRPALGHFCLVQVEEVSGASSLILLETLKGKSFEAECELEIFSGRCCSENSFAVDRRVGLGADLQTFTYFLFNVDYIDYISPHQPVGTRKSIVVNTEKSS